MKKILLCMMFLFGSAIYSFVPGEVYYEAKLARGLNFTVDSSNSDARIEVKGIGYYGLETYYKITDRVDVGTGVWYIISTTTKINADSTRVSETTQKTPAYVIVKMHMYPEDINIVNPYAKLMYGYEFVQDSDIDAVEDGEYMGVAVGAGWMNLIAEAFMTVEGNYESSEDFETATVFGLALGYRF
jgi:outer membrane protein W